MNIIFDKIGFYGPLISAALNTLLLWKRTIFLIIYIFSLIVNGIINKILKLIIREPRPDGYQKNSFDKYGYNGADIYGMPSAHSQSMFFSLIYSWLVLHSVPLFIIQLFICSLTVYQRWKYKKHSPMQLFIGACIGSIFAYTVFYTTKTFLKTKGKNIIV
jgi:membrane-associated phospholipid phosphatase